MPAMETGVTDHFLSLEEVVPLIIHAAQNTVGAVQTSAA
jgi:hypothetical protein